MKVCSNPIGQQIDQSDLSIISYSRISYVQCRKSQVLISFRSRVIEETVAHTDFLDRTLTVAFQQ